MRGSRRVPKLASSISPLRRSRFRTTINSGSSGSRFVPPRKTENIGQLSYFQATTLIAPLERIPPSTPLSFSFSSFSLSPPFSPVFSFFSYVTFRIVYAAQTVRLRYIGCGSKAQGGGLLLLTRNSRVAGLFPTNKLLSL